MSIQTETTQIETLKSQRKLFVMLARKFQGVSFTYCHMELISLLLTCMQNCLIQKQNFFGRWMNQTA